ncbi:tRNA (adenosine(37)-N6)-threonylcarbamoyltransferase complex ATPase subunit type 1 TsaE [Legionella oakridgensis]|uniref:tRNA threonylcarbamoyladenosine biosynthesis protein TsaE n=2 Tax=Legionella oakridgensis TaxID=29423 RepID=W0BEB3_9GAMM|nr:tRNA (adenosine(37)-N6)-threonylcarbamoyltransferase complex ATPase subunit type 1 TsaE [Legionella oakridgensis]AHE68210.1 ATPase, YjeE family [Legionella oakridgensis ATCC 33761 = DSM 21215]ETO92295.1 ATPase, YjeE family [Legionella oakridgensis RV-2-2007]KTD39593.1 ATPase with strong ADP affinity [Legionella oakridgensis]STY21171.1 ATPase with strong ADP affinity [Legionella longbeachae]
MNLIINLPNEYESEQIATRLAACLRAPLILTFSGEIGAGKTTLIRALLRALGIYSAIKSPTFSLIESYQMSDLHIHHFDLYRIQDEAELDYLGFRDYFSDNTICLIEWPERAVCYLEQIDVGFLLSMSDEGRTLNATAYSAVGFNILTTLAGE